MENLLLWGFYVFTFYAFLPGLISRTFGFRVFKKGSVDKEICLTFDDGPDPTYTPQLLDLLARYSAKATFFVVGVHAEANTELLQRMKAEGHIIGIHNYVHKSNWLMRPRTVKRQIERTADIIENATGQRSTYYRPPWGIVNVFDYANLGHLQIILWSAMFNDWRIRVGEKRLTKRMMKKLKPGEVLLLHDCGRTFGADKDAPRNMLIALEAYLKEGTKKGYRFVGIDEMIKLTDAARAAHSPIWKRAMIWLWLLWEKAFHIAFRLKTVGDTKDPAFHYRVTTYNGVPITFAEGGGVAKGDLVAELHFDNKMLSTIAATSKSPVATGIRMLREVEQALPLLANQLADDAEAKNIKAVYGVTMIHRGADRLGFEIFQLPEGWFAKSTRVYLRILIRVLTTKHKTTKNHSSKKKKEVISPRMLLMPAATISRYAAVKLSKIHEEAERITDAVERTINAATDEAAQLGTKTTAI
ncbi:peptidoglycan/xylan/chitin deacetylase (PgdA/CDA1 family) [Paenibacillus castaneae]|uniref:polysaccharide deacetylase family protein n=1 Tax=Paenibacillus castaneae TaxID=474957 RepID=UPI000C9A687B|nr:polysaccharide deacetylase family protein [Paenibacillus castaneae]NIK74924.1 peptidoglycan/xylan/chitin deacetylase (PgdA/CDA1 family) [Paenibacillus castaneae]